MGASGSLPRISAFITLYCNPFFCRCKQNFYFFQKIFHREQENAAHFPQYLPKSAKEGPKQRLRGSFSRQSAQKQSGSVAETNVSAADTKAVDQPDMVQSRKKKRIGSGGVLMPQGTQEFIPDAKHQTHQNTAQKALGGKLGRDHPSRRLSQPPEARFSS